jgi:hypothetical protein
VAEAKAEPFVLEFDDEQQISITAPDASSVTVTAFN